MSAHTCCHPARAAPSSSHTTQAQVHCGFTTSAGLWVKFKTGVHTQGPRRDKKEAGPSRVVGGSFNKQGDLLTRLVLGGCTPLPSRILKVSREASMGFSPVHHPDGLNTTILSQGTLNGSWSRKREWKVHFGGGGGVKVCGASHCLGPAFGFQVNQWSCPQLPPTHTCAHFYFKCTHTFPDSLLFSPLLPCIHIYTLISHTHLFLFTKAAFPC